MALNQLGLGLVFTAQNLASTAIIKLAADFSKMDTAVTGGSVRITAALKQVGIGLAGVAGGAIGLAVLKGASKRFETFEDILAKTQVTGQLTAQEMIGLESVVVDLSRTFGTELQATATGLFGIVSAGLSDAGEAAQFFGAAQKLAIAGSAGLAESVRALIGLTIGYGKSVTEAANASDVLALAAARSQADVSSFAAALPQVIPLASALKISIVELVAGIAAITETTATASEASTQLASIFSAVLRGTKQSQEAAKELGIEFTLTALKTKGLAQFLDEIGKASKGSEEKLTKLFGRVEAVRGALSLGGAQANTFKRFIKDLGNAAGTTDRAFATMATTSKFLTDQLKVASDVIITQVVGKAITPMFNATKRLQLAFLNFLIAIPRPLTRFTVKILGLAFAFALLVGAIIAFNAAMTFLPIVIAAVGGALATLGALLLPITAALLAIATVVLAIKGAIAINLFGIRDAIDDTVTSFKSLISLFQTGKISGSLAREFLKMGSGFQDFTIQIFRVGARIRGFFSGLSEGFQLFLQQFGINIKSSGNILDTFLSLVAGLIRLILDKLPDTVEAFKQFGKSIFQPEALKNVISFVDKIAGLAPVLDKMIVLTNSPLVNKLAGVERTGSFGPSGLTFGGAPGGNFRPAGFDNIVFAPAPRVPAPTSPGAAAAGVGATQSAASGGRGETITVVVPVNLDGEQIATVTAQAKSRSDMRKGNTTPGRQRNQ